MPEIRLVKKYPHIKDEDVINIFQEGYVKGFENGRKGAIPIEWMKRWFERQVWQGSSPTDRIHCKASDIIEDWEKENATEVND